MRERILFTIILKATPSQFFFEGVSQQILKSDDGAPFGWRTDDVELEHVLHDLGTGKFTWFKLFQGTDFSCVGCPDRLFDFPSSQGWAVSTFKAVTGSFDQGGSCGLFQHVIEFCRKRVGEFKLMFFEFIDPNVLLTFPSILQGICTTALKKVCRSVFVCKYFHFFCLKQ
jgi:hypothetical protein